MDWKKLEKYKLKFQLFKNKIENLESFLSQIDTDESPIYIISPYLISQQLHINELEAIFLLSLAEKEHLLHKVYKVWTLDNDCLLGEYEKQELIPDRIYNPNIGKDVVKSDFYVDLVYEIDR